MHILGKLAGRLRAGDAPAERLYEAAVAQARNPHFYRNQGVADTTRGRFELICLHVFLILRRLKTCGRPGRVLAQALHDMMFADMDRSLREMGIGDMSVGKRVKQLAVNLYGRIRAYDGGLDAGSAELAAALRRNLYTEAEPSELQVAGLAAYLHGQVETLSSQECDALLSGKVDFDPLPVFPAPT